MLDVVLATGRNMPHGPAEEDPILVEALKARGISASVEPWGTPNSIAARLVLVRTTWDYTAHLSEFIAWLRSATAITTVLNPVEVIEWNCHKSYLLDLAYAGVPMIPTTLITCGSPEADVAVALEEYDGDVVIKPAVSVGAIGTIRTTATSEQAATHLTHLVEVGDALVQPYEPSITDGESSLVFFGREFSHAMRKVPAAGDFRVQVFHGGVNVPHDPTPDERDVAAKALAAIEGDLAYARVDLVATARGPVVMEVELIEPQLFLDEPGGPADRFAEYLAGRVGSL